MSRKKCVFFLLICLLALLVYPSAAQDTTPAPDSRVIHQDMVITPVKVATINGNNINVRSAPSRSGDILTQFDQGATLKVVSEQDGWVEVKLLNGTGWIAQSLVTVAEVERPRFSEPTPEVQAAIDEARAFTGRNSDWEPFEWVVGDISLMLVPKGCFKMGEMPNAFEVCFDAPFWVDKYEVTNGQFASLGGEAGRAGAWSDDDRPRERINWFEARAFCELRDSRLPTEAEWEYAARGPSALRYPWGGPFIGDYAVNKDNSDNETAPVGSRPRGRSWVGAQDMTGNVMEWTTSIWGGPADPDAQWAWSGTGYGDYPYDASDGREADTGSRTDVTRVLRGGSLNYGEYQSQSVFRFRFNPDNWNYYIGFRCVRSIDDNG
ncbi:MAG: SUMF1/EgtB/PvdO family nonheme iron enzyme [Anaerolineaceae bacterium]|nr:SUMF1/EgtB/PvdO family nonheme iron enzyme [Anaerolineaceae bacterium]